jgi:hypothetical protein
VPGLTIPASSRVIVRGRDQQRCVVCAMRAMDWHHRRTRRVRDEHTHCPCNGITLCGRGNATGDHGWVHGNPFEARAQGLIISRYETRMPHEVPVYLPASGGWVLLNCDGSMTETDEPEEGGSSDE